MYSYAACGLTIRSDIRFPELAYSRNVADITIRLGSVKYVPDIVDEMGVSVRASAEVICCYLKNVGTFIARRGREITVEPQAAVEEKFLRHFILNWALAVTLFQRGLLVLHGSAVAVKARAAIFLGESGSGKSTTAAALHAHGHRVLADDMVVLHLHAHERAVIFPSLPRLRLCPKTIDFLGYHDERQEALNRWDERRELLLIANSVPCTPVPVARIYVLSQGKKQTIESLCAYEAFRELVRHTSYAVRRVLEVKPIAALHLLRCTRLVTVVPICRLRRKLSLSMLSNLHKLINDDLSAHSGRHSRVVRG